MKELKKLISGFNKFRQQYYLEEPELIKTLVKKGQSPKIMVIACCDSRVSPALVLNAEPGDLFVVRNVSNIVPPCEDDGKSHGTSAAMEFAVKHLGVRHIIILGHSQCGGIRSLMEGEHHSSRYEFIDPWMSTLTEARDKVLTEFADKSFDEQCYQCELAGIVSSLNNLHGFPWLKQKIDEGSLFIHGWYFNIGNGELLMQDEASGQFIPVK